MLPSYFLMGKFTAHHPVGKGAQQSADNNHTDDPIAVAEQHVHGSRAASDQGPAQSEYRPGQQVAGHTQFHGGIADKSVAQSFHFASLHERDNDDAQYHGGTNDAIHMEALKAKHLVNTEPGNGFRFGHNNAEENTYG